MKAAQSEYDLVKEIPELVAEGALRYLGVGSEPIVMRTYGVGLPIASLITREVTVFNTKRGRKRP